MTAQEIYRGEQQIKAGLVGVVTELWNCFMFFVSRMDVAGSNGSSNRITKDKLIVRGYFVWAEDKSSIQTTTATMNKIKNIDLYVFHKRALS